MSIKQTAILKITKEVKAALLVLSAIALLIFGYNFLKGNNLLTTDRTFYALYDNVEGLTTSSVVTINGLHVGKVLSIDFADKEGKLKVAYSVESDFEFGKNSVAKIYSSNIMGGKSLAIVPEYNSTILAKNKDFLKGKVEGGMLDMMTSQLLPLESKIDKTIGSLDAVLISVNNVLDENNTKNISHILSDLSATMKSFKSASSGLDGIVSKNEMQLSQTLSNLNGMSTDLKGLSSDLSKMPIEDLIKNANKAITDFSIIAANLKTTNGTAGKLLNDDQLYNNLTKASRQLNLLLQDVKLNPKRYVNVSVFGRKQKEYVQPTDSLK